MEPETSDHGMLPPTLMGAFLGSTDSAPLCQHPQMTRGVARRRLGRAACFLWHLPLAEGQAG